MNRGASWDHFLGYLVYQFFLRPKSEVQILAMVFGYLPPFISQILDFIYLMVLIFILIYFGWRDTEL